MGRDLFASDKLKETKRPGRDLFAQGNPQESALKKLPRNIVTGLTHAGRELHNLPHDIAQLSDTVGSKIGRVLGAPELQENNSDLASYFPYDTQNYANVWGQKGQGTPVDNMIQKGIEIAPDVIGGFNALRSLGLLPHLTQKGASKSLRKAREIGKQKNIAPLEVNPDLIEDTKQFFPNTTPYRNLVEEAGYGDYGRLFDLQSDLGKHAGSLSKDWFSKANRAHGKAGLQVRGNILNEMKQSLKQQGHGEIADLITKGQDEYRKYKKFKPYRNAIGVAGAAYMMPKNALIDLAQKLIMMKKGEKSMSL
jgi:hypothetical protein